MMTTFLPLRRSRALRTRHRRWRKLIEPCLAFCLASLLAVRITHWHEMDRTVLLWLNIASASALAFACAFESASSALNFASSVWVRGHEDTCCAHACSCKPAVPQSRD